MAKPSRSRHFSKKLLLGVAVSTLPLAGCELTPAETEQVENAAAAAPQQERAAFQRAQDAGTVSAVEEFLRAYPNGDLVRRLLTTVSPATLRRIDRGLVARISPSVLSSLPFDVRQALGVPLSSDSENNPDDGYSG